MAYNSATGERVVVDLEAGAAGQAQALAARGLVVSEAARLRPELLADLSAASMMREGCVVFNGAFVAATLLWLVVGGSIALFVRIVRRKATRPR